MSTYPAELRRYFLGWQCRIRQLSAREQGGRPLPGMQPYLTYSESLERVRITTVLVKREPADETAEFKHMVRKTPDAAQRYESAVRMLSAHYYQHPETFSDEMTALFSQGAALVERLLPQDRCTLDFEHATQRFRLPCAVRNLQPGSAEFEATYWHNLLFNPALPAGVSIVGFRPDWGAARAEPPVT